MGKSKKPGKLIFVGYDIGKEKWKTIYLDGEKTKYKISNYGRVKNKNTKKILATILDRYGYEQVCLIHKGKRHSLTVHTLVAKYFIPNKEHKPQVNHKDGTKYNNFEFNLEWATSQENVIHAYRTGLHDYRAMGENHGLNVYTEEQIHDVCKLLEKCELGIKAISDKTGVSKATIHDIIAKKYWTQISCNYNIDNYSTKKVHGIDTDIQEKIIKLAKQQKSVHEIRAALNLPYSDNSNARIAYYVKKYKDN